MIAEIQVAPSPAGTAEDPHAHVEAAIAVIQASGLRYEVGALGTTLEGDDDLVDLAAGHRLVVTVEDGGRAGGVGTTLTQALQDRGCDVPVRTMGLPQRFFDHGSRGQVLADAGLTEQDVARRVVEWAARLADRPSGANTVSHQP